jgi:hypothetical protein
LRAVFITNAARQRVILFVNRRRCRELPLASSSIAKLCHVC